MMTGVCGEINMTFEPQECRENGKEDETNELSWTREMRTVGW